MTTTELITLEGDKPIYASQLNDNFDLLDDNITALATSVTNLTASSIGALPTTGGTLTGNLTISQNAPYIYLKNTAQTAGTTPSANQTEVVYFTDKNGRKVGSVVNEYSTNGDRSTYLYTTPGNGDSANGKSMGIYIPASGDPYGYCPTPASNANNNTIATTRWVRALLSENITKSANGGVKLPNGIIIEWATFTTSSDTSKKWTFKNSFTSSSSYAVAGLPTGSGECDWVSRVTYSSGSYCYVYINDRTVRYIAVGY